MINAQNVSKKYDQRGIAGVDNLSLTVAKGEVVGIIGPNGGGKTTFLRIINGDFSYESGSIKTEGPLAFFPKTDFPTSGNVQKFLIASVTSDIDDEKKIQLARDLADTFEFTFQLRQDLSQVSSGQKQKILLASVLINRPSILLMDEPFAHLDPFTRKDILRDLFQYLKTQEISVLWVTHDLDEGFKFSDRIGVMNFGKFTQLGTPIDIVTKPQNLFVAQFIGYRNFFVVKKINQKWLTPWGEFESALEKEEAVFIVPDHSLIVSDQGAEFKVIHRHAYHQGLEYKLELDGRAYFMTKPSQSAPLSSKVQIVPKWEDCFIIPL